MEKINNLKVSKKIEDIKSYVLEVTIIGYDNYNSIPIKDFDINTTLYENFQEMALNEPAEIILRDCKKDTYYTYQELLNIVDKTAEALIINGVKQSDLIALPISHSLEATAMLLAINKVGATSFWCDCYLSEFELKEKLKELGDKLSFIVAEEELVGEKINNIKSDLKLDDKNILIVNTNDNSKNSNFNQFINHGKDEFIVFPYVKPDDVAVLISSSGSTGKPKYIKHSSKSINSSVRKLSHENFPIRDNIVTVSVPPYIGLGLITSLYSSIILGGRAELLPDYKHPAVFVNYIDTHIDELKKSDKQLILFGAPIFLEFMYGTMKSNDLSFIGGIMAAGAKMEADVLEKLNDKFKQMNCRVPICNAYGQNEACGLVTTNRPDFNKDGSAGRVSFGTEVMIYNSYEKGKSSPVGEIYEKSDAMFLGYHNNEQAYKDSMVKINGETWFKTKDIGKFDDEEYLFIFGRESRILIRADFKISLDEIEKKLSQSKLLDKVAAVKVKVIDEFGLPKEAPYVFATSKNLTKEQEDANLIFDSMQTFEAPLSPYEMPIHIEFIDDIPFNNNKVDYVKLEKIANELVKNPFTNGREELTKQKSYK